METRYIKSFASRFDEEASIQEGGLNRPYVAYLEDEQRIDWDHDLPEPDFSKNYFTVVVNEPGYFSLHANNSSISKTVKFDYSLDSGKTWITNGLTRSTSIHVSTDGKTYIWLRGDNPNGIGVDSNFYHSFNYSKFDGSTTDANRLPFDVEGNIMSLLKSSGFEDEVSLESYGNYALSGLFIGSYVTSAENLVLPATTLTQYCYNQMFYRAMKLEKAPKVLPAENSARGCYKRMFYDAFELISAPAIELSNTVTSTNIDYCYEMFYHCAKLETSPIVKFDLSTNLSVQAGNPYYRMFYQCGNLNKIICLSQNAIPNPLGITRYSEWVSSISSNGTFYVLSGTKANWESSPKNTSGVPTNWTIEEYTE